MVSVPRITFFCVAVLLCLMVPALDAQMGQGFIVQERAGLVLVKPQPWSKESEATVLEFQALINRQADGKSGAGYYEFRTKNNGRRQIPVARIVKLLVYPDSRELRQIIGSQDRQALVSKIEELDAVVAKFPASKSYLDRSIEELKRELAQYDSGKVKLEGVWVPKERFESEKAIQLTDLLKAEIIRAQPPSSIHLEDDPTFIALNKLAETNPDAKKLADDVNALLAELLRAEKRSELLAKLDRPDIALKDAEVLLDQLKKLRPEEDPKSARRVKIWDAGLIAVRASSREAEEVCKSIERELESFDVNEGPSQLSPQLEKQIFAATASIKSFLATSPPPPLAAAMGQTATLCKLAGDFNQLKVLFDEKRYLEAAHILEDVTRYGSFFGSKTMRAIADLRSRALAKIDEFTRLRNEAKLLVDSGKKPEALAKFEAAYSVIPDSDVGQNIAQLRQAISGGAPQLQ
jgi:tetratricopeptide (TPR) repeat protein